LALVWRCRPQPRTVPRSLRRKRRSEVPGLEPGAVCRRRVSPPMWRLSKLRARSKAGPTLLKVRRPGCSGLSSRFVGRIRAGLRGPAQAGGLPHL
jgi:hypothetical protein